MDGSRLRIDRHLVSWRVAGDPSSSPSGTVGNEVFGSRLADHLSVALADAGDLPGVWRIRRLDAHALVGAGWPAEDIARMLGLDIRRALHRAIATPSSEVVWYPDRSSYLAAFLVDCCTGRAFGRWEYAEYEHLAGLAVSRAVTEAIADEPVTALAALRTFAEADVRILLRQLTGRDADEVLSVLGSRGSGSELPVGSGRAVPVLAQLLTAGALPDDHRLAALTVFVALARDDPSGDPAGLEASARDLAAAVCAFARCDGREHDALRRALSADGTIPAAAWMAIIGSPDLSGFAQWPTAERRQVVDLLTEAARGSVNQPAGTELRTPLGGMFLLLPLLAELPWREATDGWPALAGVPGARVVAFLAVIGALGAERNLAAFRDPTLRMATGIPDQVSLDDIVTWAGRLPAKATEWLVAVWTEHLTGVGLDAPAAPDPYATLVLPVPPNISRTLAVVSDSLLRGLSWRLPGFSRSSLPYLWDNFLDFDALVRREDERVVVECGKPPLEVVLSLTGMKRKRFRLEATGSVEWVLTNHR